MGLLVVMLERTSGEHEDIRLSRLRSVKVFIFVVKKKIYLNQ
jgi:hypothetical protein